MWLFVAACYFMLMWLLWLSFDSAFATVESFFSVPYLPNDLHTALKGSTCDGGFLGSHKHLGEH